MPFKKGAIEEGLAKKQLKDSTVVSLTAMGEAINEVKSGQVDAVDLEKPVAEGYVHKIRFGFGKRCPQS